MYIMVVNTVRTGSNPDGSFTMDESNTFLSAGISSKYGIRII